MLARRGEAKLRPLAHGGFEIPVVAGEIDRHAVVILGSGGAVRVEEALELTALVTRDPTCRHEWRPFDMDSEIVLRLDARGQHVQLQGSDYAYDPIAAHARLEDARDAFFRKLLQRARQMLGLERVFEAHAAQDFRREIGNAGNPNRLAFGEGIADPQRAV